MKKTISTLIIGCLVTGTMAAQAQFELRHGVEIIASGAPETVEPAMRAKRMARSVTSRAGEPTVDVTVKVSYDASSFEALEVHYGDPYQGFYADPKPEQIVKIPSGGTTLIATFREISTREMYIVAKNIVPEPGMTVSFNPTEAVNTIQYKLVNADGTPMKVSKLQRKDGIQSVIEQGDFDEAHGLWLLASGLDKMTIYNMAFFIDDIEDVDGGRNIKYSILPFHINNLDEGNSFIGDVLAYNKEKRLVFAIQMPSSTTGGEYTNDPANFVTTLSEGSLSTASQEYSDELYTMQFLAMGAFDVHADIIGMTNLFPLEPDSDGLCHWEIITCCNNEDDNSAIIWDNIPYEPDNAEISLEGPLWIPTKTGRRYLPANTSIGGANTLLGLPYYLTEKTTQLDKFFQFDPIKVVNPYLPLSKTNMATVIGNSCPIFVFAGQWPEGISLEEGFFYNGYIGRTNDNRLMDTQLQTTEQSVTDRKIIMDIENDNVLIDGILKGGNHTKLVFCTDEEDFVPPTLQSLQFKNTDGIITDRFEKATDASVEFYAGDFMFHENYMPGDMYSYYSVAPLASVSASYAPYGSEDFKRIEVNENPDYFFMPGYGYFYNGSLESVNTNSPNGWFDMQISLTDASGNMQTQTISPAFYISGSDAIETIEGDGSDTPVKIEGDMIMASENADIYTMSGIRCKSRHVAPGVYIVVTPSQAVKVIVR